MTLDNDDKKWIVGAIKDGVIEALDQAVGPRFDVLEKDMTVMKKDISVLKKDVGGLKSDVNTLKSDVSDIKSDVEDIKIRLIRVETKLGPVLDHHSNRLDSQQKQIDRLNVVVGV